MGEQAQSVEPTSKPPPKERTWKLQPDGTEHRACEGCGRIVVKHGGPQDPTDVTPGYTTLRGSVLPHDEEACVRAHVQPVYQGDVRGVPRVLPNDRRTKKARAVRARVGLL